MQMFDVQGVEIHAPRARVLEFVANPANLPKWAQAFVEVHDGRAILQSSAGSVSIDLAVQVHPDAGTVDWRMAFPDGSVGVAQSRVTETTRDSCIYSFVLHAPPVPLEQIEGALEAQRVTLRAELAKLCALMEGRP